jgi:hypothetical protein
LKRRAATFRVNQHTHPVAAGRKETPPMLRVVEKPGTREEGDKERDLDELAREGARRMLVKALKAEVASYVEAHERERDERGLALVVRNGKARGQPRRRGRGGVAA